MRAMLKFGLITGYSYAMLLPKGREEESSQNLVFSDFFHGTFLACFYRHFSSPYNQFYDGPSLIAI